MKRRVLIASAVAIVIVVVMVMAAAVALADKPVAFDAQGNETGWEKSNQGCTRIQDGTLLGSDGITITVGYDMFGYNYQAHMFHGRYCDYDRIIGGAYCDIDLIMKWNDAWLANTSCDEDGLLDRHYGFDTYIGSGAWETNHQFGSYVDDDGETCHWNYFVKIIAAPADATVANGSWYADDGTEIGPVIWGSFAVIQRVYNDPCAGDHGLEYLSPDHAGFGGW